MSFIFLSLIVAIYSGRTCKNTMRETWRLSSIGRSSNRGTICSHTIAGYVCTKWGNFYSYRRRNYFEIENISHLNCWIAKVRKYYPKIHYRISYYNIYGIPHIRAFWWSEVEHPSIFVVEGRSSPSSMHFGFRLSLVNKNKPKQQRIFPDRLVIETVKRMPKLRKVTEKLWRNEFK